MAQTEQRISAKRIMIDKANARIVAVTAVAAFLSVFSLIAIKSLISQASYQNRVISAQNKALSQVKADLNATTDLEASYQAFISQPQNILGGNPNPTTNPGPNDGNNAKIILDALPSTYDFPALTTSLEKMLTNENVSIQSISGTDESASQTNQSSITPTPVIMPFQIVVDGSYQAIENVINEFENSIRPFQVQTIDLAGDQSNLTLSLSAQTFYQPAKNLTTTTETIK